MRLFFSLILLWACFSLTPIQAKGFSPAGIALWHPVQLPPGKWTVGGLRFSIIQGYNKNMFGLDIAAIGATADRFAGISVAGIYHVANKGIVTGIQVAGLLNSNAKYARIYGAQLTAGMNTNGKGHLVGVQAGLLNFGVMDIYGVQVGLMNNCDTLGGIQVGIHNIASRAIGFQIGLINKTNHLTGIQIGLLNYNLNGILPFFPFILVGF